MSTTRLTVAAAVAYALLIAGPARAADPAPATKPAAASTMDEAARMNYALGYQLGKDLATVESRPQDLLRGIEDARKGTPSLLTKEESEAALTTLQAKVNEQRQKAQVETSKKAIAEGEAYLAANAKKAGWKTTASGLQYRVVTPGAGRAPAATDTVTVNYSGHLIDGQEFDSSYKRGEPATFPLNGVIKGWTEGLQLVKEGGKVELAIPPGLAYEDRGPLANQVLLFEVELMKIGAPAEAAKPADQK